MFVNYDDFPLTANESETFKIKILHQTDKKYICKNSEET